MRCSGHMSSGQPLVKLICVTDHADVTIKVNIYNHMRNKSALMNCVLVCLSVRVFVLTIFGFAGAIVWLQQVALHTAAGVGALCVCARLAACPVHIALVEIYMGITQPITHILPQHFATSSQRADSNQRIL